MSKDIIQSTKVFDPGQLDLLKAPWSTMMKQLSIMVDELHSEAEKEGFNYANCNVEITLAYIKRPVSPKP